MSEIETPEIVERKIGERVDIKMVIEPDSLKALGDGEFSAIVTTSSVDRMSESIKTDGIGYDAYMQNPVVLYGHDYSALPIGKTTKLTAYKNKIVAQFKLAVKEYPFAATVAELIKGGYLGAVSIGGVVKQWNDNYTEILQMEMVEFSVVPVPANGEALITGRSVEAITGKSAEVVAKEYHDFVQGAYAKSLKGLDNDQLGGHIKALEELTAILKSVHSEKASESQTLKTDEKITLIRKTAAKASYESQEIIKLVRTKQ